VSAAADKVIHFRGFKIIVESSFELLDGRCIDELRNSKSSNSGTRVRARVGLELGLRSELRLRSVLVYRVRIRLGVTVSR